MRGDTVRPGTVTYRSFLLQVWTSMDEPTLHASIKDVATGETRTFADLETFFDWLIQNMPNGKTQARAIDS